MAHAKAMESSRESFTTTSARPEAVTHNGARPSLSASATTSAAVSKPVVVNGARGPTVHHDWSPPVIRHIRWLLAGIGALAAVDAVTSQIAARHMASAVDAFQAAATANGFDNSSVVTALSSGITSATTVGAAVTVVVPVLLIGLRRPSKPARIAAITAMILLVLNQLVGVAANPNLFADAPAQTPPELAAAWNALLPAWYVWTHYALQAAMLLGAVVAGVKLSTENASEYFSLRHLVTADDPRLWSTERYLAAARRR